MRLSRHVILGALLAASGTLGACIGEIGGGSDDPTESGSAPLCQGEAGPQAGAAPMRRLTRLEYNNTVRDLLGDHSNPANAFLPDEIVGGFSANSVAPVDPTLLEDYFEVAEAIAIDVVQNRLSDVTACDVNDADCMHDAIGELGGRAFRRPLTPELRDSLVALYDGATVEHGGAEAFELVLQAMLLSPHFLYHVELAPPETGNEVVALDAYELAARLSYFVWASMPDAELMQAAESGALGTDAGLEAEVRRLLSDDKASDAIASFHGQWLALDRHGDLEGLYKDVSVFPTWNPALGTSMRAETEAFANHVIRDGDGRLDTLLTADFSFVDANLADHYGLPSPTGGGMAKVDMPSERAGLLTHASVLTSQAHASTVSWALRGKLVREQLLCEELMPPPPSVDANASNDPDRLTNPNCAGCHQLMDPIGFGFDGFDGLGRSRDVDDVGDPVDTSGDVTAGVDTEGSVAGSFDGVRELASQLAQSAQVQRCYATQWFRYATRRDVGDDDACTAERIANDFANSGRDIRELIVAVALSDGFRFRRTASNGDNQ
jgi:Protein of unknown function (DUF1592)/Protein of unknown function (DUF1588)/Protein of unknown function (DUF1585)/Protein of unknown function (DUF1587)/Protein of unknown function (DUF1595)